MHEPAVRFAVPDDDFDPSGISLKHQTASPFPTSISRKHLLALPIIAVALVGFASLFPSDSALPSISHILPASLSPISDAALVQDNDDYYAQPGILQVDRRDEVPKHRQARWLHLDVLDTLAQNNQTGLEGGDVQDFEDGWNLLDEYTKASSPAASIGNDDDNTFSYMKDKTIVLIGDSVDRGAIDGMCEFLRGKLTYRQFGDHSKSLLKTYPYEKWRSAPHHCQLPHDERWGNASIWSFMTYSSMASEKLFEVPLKGVHPRVLDKRLDLIAGALDRVNVVPDLILFHTLVWDLNALNLMDAIANAPPSEALSVDYLVAFRTKLASTLTLVNTLFPKAQKMYRLLHDVKVDKGDWFMAHTPKGTQHISRIPYANNKGEQLNSIVRSLVPSYKFTLFDFKSVLSGYTIDFQDAIHPGGVGKTLYTQMLLYYLKKLT